ncbi:MAG: aldehyde dehydrogenase family protein [Acidimicrobiales bacterium]|jgi:aldehyde dehydrogenase (NAD+)
MSTTLLSSLVGGEWLHGEANGLDRNPSRPEEVVAEVSFADAEVMSRAVGSAREAFPGWRDTASPARGEILRRAADLLEARAEEIGRDLAREEGKALVESIGETRRAAAVFRYFAGQTLEPDGETYPSSSAKTLLFARREPLGVVAAITPWNFPIAIPAWKIAPALAYGNVVVWKPAAIVPLTAVHMARALVDAGLPSGVLNLVLGRGAEVGDALVTHDALAALTFTGSNELGRRLQIAAALHGTKVQLELGGKNPAVVLADADLDFAAEQVARGAFLSTGQKCTATSRVIVERSVFDDFAARLAKVAASWPTGDPLEPGTKVGPLSSEDQFGTVTGYLDIAREDGGEALAGGAPDRDGGGYFVPPTVLVGLAPSSRVVREEIFGPVAALLPADSYEEAVALANDTPFGLSAGVFTTDLAAALRFARDIRAGVVKINDETAGVEFHVPFGGMKGSSSGSREQGKAAREFFTEWKTVYVNASH